MLNVRYMVLTLALLCPVYVLAQAVSPSGSGTENQQTIASLVRQVKALQQLTRELEEKVKILEAGRPAGTAEPNNTAAMDPPPPTRQEPATDSSRELPTELHELQGIQWKGFGEVNYKALDQRQPETGTYGFVSGSAGNFYTGDFDLFLRSRLTERAAMLADIAFEETDAQGFKLDLRQALLKYDLNDRLRISFGRYQTGIGYYNWAFRSAAWLQTAADRPLVMEYATNGGLLPTQAVGVSVAGSIPSGAAGLNCLAEYGSSDTIRPDINGSGLLNDESDGNHILVGLFIRPDPVPGLQVGGSFFHDEISDSVAGPSVRYGQTIANAYAVYSAHAVEFLNEAFLIRHSRIGAAVLFNTPAFYTQLSKKIGPIRPFFRYQYVNASLNNTFYDDVGLRYGPSFGARYDVNEYIALKTQLDHTVRKGQPDLNGLHLQVAFAF